MLNFVNSQYSQVVATKGGDVARVRTGYDKVISSLSRHPFAVVAKQHGTVIDVDTQLNLFKVQYKDGSFRTFEYGVIPTNNGGVYITQNVECIVSKGQKFKPGDTLCYNRDYFKITSDKIPTLKMGVMMNIAFIENDNTIEDSSGVSRKAALHMGFEPVHRRTIAISKESNIFNIVSEGQDVLNTHDLMVFDDGAIPDVFLKAGYAENIAELNRSTPKCKYTGKIIKVSVLYNCPISTMSESLASTVTRIIKKQNSKASFAGDDTFSASKPLIGERKLGKAIVGEESVVFDFYIREQDSLDAGDKIVIASSLKSVVSEVFEDPMIAVDILDRDNKPVELDGLFSQSSASNRIITSVMIMGIGEVWAESLERKVVDMWEG